MLLLTLLALVVLGEFAVVTWKLALWLTEWFIGIGVIGIVLLLILCLIL